MKFSNMVVFHLKNMFRRKEFYLAFLLSIIFLFITAIPDLIKLYQSDVLTLYPAWMYFGLTSGVVSKSSRMVLQAFMMLLLPFTASLTFSYSYFDDYQSGVLKAVLPRTKKSIYFYSTAFVTFISAFLITFIPLFFRELLFVIAIPINSSIITPGYPTKDLLFRNVNFFKNICLNHPYIYFVIYCFIPAFIGALIGCLSFSLSLFYKKNRFIILTLPGIVYIVFCFICALIGKPGISLNYLIMPPQGIKGLYLAPLIIETLILIVINTSVLSFKIYVQKDEL